MLTCTDNALHTHPAATAAGNQPRSVRVAMRVFRTVFTNPPGAASFLSMVALGKHINSKDPKFLRLAEGVSVWTSRERALEKASDLRFGDFLAELEIPEDGSVEYETGRGGHVTIWMAAQDFLALVTAVHPIER